jgi:hypothetical protein
MVGRLVSYTTRSGHFRSERILRVGFSIGAAAIAALTTGSFGTYVNRKQQR